jgi:hypothetical protein
MGQGSAFPRHNPPLKFPFGHDGRYKQRGLRGTFGHTRLKYQPIRILEVASRGREAHGDADQE